MCSKHYSTYILRELHGEKEFADTAEFVTVAGESFVSCYIMDSKKTPRRRQFRLLEIAFCDFVILITELRNNYHVLQILLLRQYHLFSPIFLESFVETVS